MPLANEELAARPHQNYPRDDDIHGHRRLSFDGLQQAGTDIRISPRKRNSAGSHVAIIRIMRKRAASFCDVPAAKRGIGLA